MEYPKDTTNPQTQTQKPPVAHAQVWVGVVPVGPTGAALNSSYGSRDSPAYKTDLGLALANWARIVPDGLLVFFPSYVVMAACIAHWKGAATGSGGVLGFAGTLWDRITAHKQAVIEPKVPSPSLLGFTGGTRYSRL